MVNINLLPEKVRAAETLKLVVIIGTLCLTLPLLFWTYRYIGDKAKLAAVEQKIEVVNSELNSPKLKQVVQEVEQFGRDRADLDAKRSVVDLLRKKQVTVLRFLDVLPDLVPKRAWLTKVELKDEKGSRKVFLEGMALSSEVVADLYANLEAHAVIKNPSMDAAPTQVLQRGKSIVNFKLSFAIEDQL
jgi:type IV pilus assembly protein PilN